MSKENDDPKLIVGLINIDNQVRKEEAYTEALADAENLATTDALTGIKNKHAYSAAEAALKKQLDAGTLQSAAYLSRLTRTCISISKNSCIDDLSYYMCCLLFMQCIIDIFIYYFKHYRSKLWVKLGS